MERIGRKPEALIPILQALQEHHGYLPPGGAGAPGRVDRHSTLRHFGGFDLLRYVPPQAGGQTYSPGLPRHGLSCGGSGEGGGGLAAATAHSCGRRHGRGAAVHHRTGRLPGLLHARARGENGRLGRWDTPPRRNLRTKSATISPGQTAAAGVKSTEEMGRAARQRLGPNPRRPGFLLHGQGKRPIVSRLARERGPMRRAA